MLIILSISADALAEEPPAPASQPAGAAKEGMAGPASMSLEEARQKARELFSLAETQYRLGRFEAALEGYEAALKYRHHTSIIFNIAQCHRQLGHLERAVFFYKLFLSDWEREKPGTRPPNVSEVKGHIARLTEELKKKTTLEQKKKIEETREQLARLPEAKKGLILVEGITVVGAQILVGGVLRGVSPISEPIMAEVGTVEVRVEAAGFLPWRREVIVRANAETILKVGLRAIPRKSTLWLVSTLGALALAAGAEALAIIYYKKANEHYVDTDPFRSDRTIVIVGHTLAGTFAALSATSLVLYLVSGRIKPEEPARAAVVPLPGGAMTVGGFRF